jgi:hypothetical protein
MGCKHSSEICILRLRRKRRRKDGSLDIFFPSTFISDCPRKKGGGE